MISKDTFCKAIRTLQRKTEAGNAVQKLLEDYSDILLDGMAPIDNTDVLITQLIEEDMDLHISEVYGSTLFWWIWEKDFGATFKKGDIRMKGIPQDSPYCEPDLSSAEQLYDFLIFETEYYKNH